jgi:hypothetical protein
MTLGHQNIVRGAYNLVPVESREFNLSVGSMCHTIERTDRQGYPNC